MSEAREDRALAITERSMRNYLRDFKSVCHFWTAHRILEESRPFFEVPRALSDAGQLERFLGHAEWFLECGIAHRSRNYRTGPLLERAAAWTPSVRNSSLRPELGEFPTSLSDAISSYRAH